MKLSVCITLFNGLELLDKCIENHENYADEIILCWQDVSYTGVVDNTVYDKIKKYEGRHTLVKYNPNLSLSPKDSEIDKHNFMLDRARESRATHFLLSAVDHFYDPYDVDYLKGIIPKEDLGATFTHVETYYKEPTWQITPRMPWLMPFICALYPQTEFRRRVKGFPVKVDKACRMTTFAKWCVYEHLVCHNYAGVRQDYESKIRNAPRHSKRWSVDFQRRLIDQFNNYDPTSGDVLLQYKHTGLKPTIKEVPNYFNL